MASQLRHEVAILTKHKADLEESLQELVDELDEKDRSLKEALARSAALADELASVRADTKLELLSAPVDDMLETPPTPSSLSTSVRSLNSAERAPAAEDCGVEKRTTELSHSLTSELAASQRKVIELKLENSELKKLLEVEVSTHANAGKPENSSLLDEMNLAEQLLESRATIHRLQDELDESAANLEAVQAQLDANRSGRRLSQFTSMPATNGSLFDEMSSITKEFDRANLEQEIADLTKQLMEHRNKKALLSGRNAELVETLEQLKMQLAASQAEVVDLRCRVSANGSKEMTLLDDAQVQVRDLAAKNEVLNKNLESANERIHKLNGKDSQSAVLDLRRENAMLRQQAAGAEIEAKTARADLQMLKAKQNFLNEQLAEAQMASAGIMPSLAAAQTKWAAELKSMQTTLTAVRSEKTQLQHQLAESHGHQAELAAILEARKKELSEALNRLDVIDKEQFGRRLHSIGKERPTQEHVMDIRLDVAQRRIEKLSSQLAAAQAENREHSQAAARFIPPKSPLLGRTSPRRFSRNTSSISPPSLPRNEDRRIRDAEQEGSSTKLTGSPDKLTRIKSATSHRSNSLPINDCGLTVVQKRDAALRAVEMRRKLHGVSGAKV